MTQTIIDKKQFYYKLRVLSVPIIFQNLMSALVAACDALMLGRIAQEQMTAVSLATQVQFIQLMVILAITGAGGILGAQYWGKGDKKTLRSLFNMVLRISGLVSILFFAVCELVPGALMSIFAGDAGLIEIGSEYLRIAGWSYLVSGIAQSYQAIMRVTDHVKMSAVISSSAVVMNVVLNAVFIFGLQMEARGAALATTLSRVIEMGLCILVSFGASYLKPDWKHFFSSNRQLSKDYARQLLPILFASLLWGIGFASYTAIVGHLGVDAAAANSVAAVVRDLSCCVCNGVGAAAGIMVGNELGAGHLDIGKAYGIKLVKLGFLIGIVCTGVLLAITPLIIHIVILTPEAQQYLTGMMIIMAIYMIGRCFNTVTINGVLDGGGDTIFDMYSLAVSMWAIAIPLALLGAFVFHWPVLLVYACTCLDEVGKIPWVIIRVRKYKWVRNLTRTL